MSDFRFSSSSGHELQGHNLVRMIYTDEAGISAKESKCVVASVLVNADDQYRVLAKALEEVFDRYVPAKIRNKFVFHGTDVFSGGKGIDRSEWSAPDRLAFFKEVVQLPFLHDVPVAFAVVDKTWPIGVPVQEKDLQRFHHVGAFARCMERADLFLRKYLAGQESGTVICEDIPQHRAVLAEYGLMYRDNPFSHSSDVLRQESWQARLGISPDPVTYRIDHIIDVPHFVPKGAASMIQLADACAFTIRRWLNKESFGDELAIAMFGPHLGPHIVADPVWYEGCHSYLLNTTKYWSDQQLMQNVAYNLALSMVSRSSNSKPIDEN